MIYLRNVNIDHVWAFAGISSPLGAAGPKKAPVWSIVTPVRDDGVKIVESKFYKSIKAECDEAGKKSSVLMMLNQLRYAVQQSDYQAFLKETPVHVKEAHSFTHRGSKHKVWELKYQNKDRIYFFTHQGQPQADSKLLITALYHHKNDQKTPQRIRDYCETAMKPFLESAPKVAIIKEES
jgi:hypothetical protein